MRKHILIVAMCVVLIGCATIVNDNYVDLPVETEPPGATVTYNGQTYITPCALEIPRGEERTVIVRVEKPGYKPVEIRLERSLDGWLWGDIVCGGLIGLAIDFISGDAYDLDPAYIKKRLKKVDEPGEAEDMDIDEPEDMGLEVGGLHIIIVDYEQI